MSTTELTHFRLDVTDGIALVVMDRSDDALNTLDPSLTEDFEVVLERLEGDDVRAAVIISGKDDSFLAGANIKWFADLTEPSVATDAIRRGHAVFDRLERLHARMEKPVVAAIHGACLGGGNELALACSHRIATDHPKTQLGQPEVQLGLIPAAGGTQRLPALIGIAPALDLILTGRSVRADKARRLGMVDEVVPPTLLREVAMTRAAEAIDAEPNGSDGLRSWLSPARLQKLALETNPVGRGVLFKQARQRMLAETKGNYPAPELAIEAVRIGVEEGRRAGLDAEARFFGELVVTPESKALRSIFFATRSGPDTSEARPVDSVAVVGGGLMGAGIATVTTQKASTPVRIKEVDEAGIGRALSYVSKALRKRVDRRRMSEFQAEQAMLRVTATTDWRGFGSTDLVIEAVFEDLELKRDVLRAMEEIVGEDTVFASNTSSLPITDIAAASSRPETVLGMHYFSPVEKMPLLEVVVTDQTADWARATAAEFGRRQGKTVIVVGDGPGFYTSRILGPYAAEAFQLLAEGASVEDVDGAMEEWGFPVGPLRLGDEVGLDVQSKIGRIMVDAFGERMAAPSFAERLDSSDRKGRKNRRGFYAYDDSGSRSGVDETVYADLGLTPTGRVPRSEIQERISFALINEAARCLEDGILRSSADGDVGAVMGIGYPPFRGGPFFTIDTLGPRLVVDRLRRLADRHGPRFDTAQILIDAAEQDRTFRS